MSLADALDGIPVVTNTTERGLRFPLPTTDQRVFNKQTGNIERYNGAAWSIDFVGDAGVPSFNLMNYVGVGYVQGTTDATAAIQAMIDAAPDYSMLVFPGQAVAYKVTGVPSINGRKGLVFIGWGATIQLSGVGAQAFRFSGGVNDDCAFYGFRVLGSGIIADDHQGFGTIVVGGVSATPAGTAGSNIRFVNCHVENCARGFYIGSSDLIFRDIVFVGCRLVNIVGTASGVGYGMCLASLIGVTVDACYFDLCQRHSLYDANCQDISITNNKFRRHRNGVSTNSVISALVVARRPNVSIIGNSFDSCEDTALSIESDESDVNQPIYNVVVMGNHFHGSVHRDMVIGSSAAATSGLLSDVLVIGNTFTRTEAANAGIESLRVFNGKGVTIAHNSWRMRNAYTVQKSPIVLGSGGIAAAFIDDLTIRGNRLDITMNAVAAYFIEVTALLAVAPSKVAIELNTVNLNGASGGLITYDAARTSTTFRIIGNNLPDSSSIIGPDFLAQEDLNATGGYRQTLDAWYQDNVAASQAAAIIGRYSVGIAFGTQWVAPRPGSITGVSVKSNAARTAGTLTITVFKNSVSTGLTAILDGANTIFKATNQAKDLTTFVPGDLIDARVTTDAGWLPITADIAVSIEVET